MSAMRELRLGTTIHGAGATKYGWRQEGVAPDASISFAHYAAVAQKAEAAELDFVFIVDSPNITPDSAPHFLNRMAGGIFRCWIHNVSNEHYYLFKEVIGEIGDPMTFGITLRAKFD
jgi:hypothetical protein